MKIQFIKRLITVANMHIELLSCFIVFLLHNIAISLLYASTQFQFTADGENTKRKLTLF